MNFIVNESLTKLRGGYYTHLDIASFLTKWVLDIHPEHILEPSCGDGIFIEALSQLTSNHVKSITAVEIEAEEAAKASLRARALRNIDFKLHTKDFLSWALLRITGGQKFDAVIGNPPFIRYQYLDDTIQKLAEKIFEYFHLPFTKHTNAWVPFVISSMALLRPAGRLAMVVPSEILHVLHAQSLRTFLTNQCSKVLIIDPEELWFDNVLQGAVLLLAEKKPFPEYRFEGVAILPTKTKAFLNDDPISFFEKAEFINGETLSGKWMKALLTKQERELLKNIAQQNNVYCFKQVADVDVGIVTGANKFFLVSDKIVDTYGLKRWAYPMFGRSEHVPGVVYDKKTHTENRKLGLPTNFLWFNGEQFDDLPKKVREYILTGEAEKLHERYKCRIRKSWYSVPSIYTSQVGMLKRCHDFHRLILNKANAFTTDTAYRIRPIKVSPSRLVYSFINSLTALCAELEGRHYGGGVLELVPSEIEKLLLPISPSVKIAVKHLDLKFRNSISPESLLSEQDDLLLGAIGLSKNERTDLISAWVRLRNRRHRTPDYSSISIKNGSVALSEGP